MVLFPPAKINLGLNVLYKRTDGYHELDTVMLPVPLFDVLEILEDKRFSFHQSGLTIAGESSDNLCVRAYKRLHEEFELPTVYMHLRKEIPMGAGLGGGSSDAAYVLKGLNQLFHLNLSDQDLEEYAAELGSDCSFFIKNQAQFCTGRGEILSECNVDLKGKFLKIVNPGIHVGTKEAYAGVVFRQNHKSTLDVVHQPMATWKDELINDFETSVFQLHPTLKEIKNELYNEGAIYAAMSGSGSTMFALYNEKPSLSFHNKNYMEKILEL
jgi:4-diphosphocytidyl-2-C-methyl-D-erythritol kinase